MRAAATFYVKREGIRGAILAHAAVLMSSPRTYFKGLGFALKLGGTDLRRLVLSFCYFVEAVMLGALDGIARVASSSRSFRERGFNGWTDS